MQTLTPKTIPQRLQSGSHIRVVAPSSSLARLEASLPAAEKVWRGLGYQISYGAHVLDKPAMGPVAAQLRAADLQEALVDPMVDAVIWGTGGAYAVELLPYLDWNLLKTAAPKVVMGMSDATALLVPLAERLGYETYYGPVYMSALWAPHAWDYTTAAMQRVVRDSTPQVYHPSPTYKDLYSPADAPAVANPGPSCLHPGQMAGQILAGHISGLVQLASVGQLPSLAGRVLCLETMAWGDMAGNDMTPSVVRQALFTLSQQMGAADCAGLLFGRPRGCTWLPPEFIQQALAACPVFADKPAAAQIDFGHTSPMLTLPHGRALTADLAEDRMEIKF